MQADNITIQIMQDRFLDDVVKLHFVGLTYELKHLSKIVPGKNVDSTGREAIKMLLKQMIKAKEGMVFVALTEQEQTVGYCLATKKIYPSESPKICGCINGIYVDDQFKRLGLGKKLYAAAESWLKTEDVEYIELYHMVNDERATAFWQSLGYATVQLNCMKRI